MSGDDVAATFLRPFGALMLLSQLMRSVRSLATTPVVPVLAALYTFIMPATAGPIAAGPPVCDYTANCIVDMEYHGGPLIIGTTDVYVIWYGNWASDDSGSPVNSHSILPQFFGDLSGSDYMNIVTNYSDGSGVPASSIVHYGGSIDVGTLFGNSLSPFQINLIVLSALSSHLLPTDPNAVYFVFTAPSVTVATLACGFHDDLRVYTAWVGTQSDCSTGGDVVSGDPYADELTRSASHELFESITDPAAEAGLGGWYDSVFNPVEGDYDEIADVCEPYVESTNLNGSNFEVQAIFVRDANNPNGGICSFGQRATASVSETSSGAQLLSGLLLLFLVRGRVVSHGRVSRAASA
jgi:hypothetical protein